MTEAKKGRGPQQWARGMALVLLGTGLLMGCKPSGPPDPPDPPDPYAGGQSYPWSETPPAGSAKPLKTGQNFLSDLSYASARNAWGPVELDRSNGSEKPGDGGPLKIGNQTFTKGIGVHAGSTLVYALNGQCSTFSATVGIDEEVGARGSVVFQVYGDGRLLVESSRQTGADGGQRLSVGVQGVRELKLVVTDGGDGIAYDRADWAEAGVDCAPTDVAPPVAPQKLSAAASSAGITLTWTANTEADLAGYRVSRSASGGGPFTPLTATLLTVPSYTDPSAPQGVPSFYQVVAVDRSGNTSAPATASATRPAPGAVLGRAALTNLDGGPFADRLVFSRIGPLADPPGNRVHDRATLRVSNTGTGPLQLTGLPITDAWKLDPALTLPLDIAPGKFQDVQLRFVAESVKVHAGTLTVETNDPTAPRRVIQLGGVWQRESEGVQEPTLEEIVQGAFGFQTAFAPGGNVNQDGRVAPQGDEVIAPYWQRIDPAAPVKVQQLAAYHTQGDAATLGWFTKGGSDSNAVLTQAGIDGQSVLPRKNGSDELAAATFAPARTFGFRVDSENSDPALNDQGQDRGNGCQDPCGQHLRFFKARDRGGQIMPGTYLLIMDYSGINYDYNDNIYLISNVKPAPILIDVGLGAGEKFTDPDQNVWFSDRDRNNYALFTPSTAKNEPDGGPNAALDILKTTNDGLYRTYRGNVGNLTPRAITYNIPLENGPQTLRLHFADLAHTTAGQRVFSVVAEGKTAFPALDIVREAGGGNTALVKTLDVEVTGGVLTLTLNATVDYPSIAGIEIVR